MESEDKELDLAWALLQGPREGDETEVTERGGGGGETQRQLFAASVDDPRPGDETEPLEEGDSLSSEFGPKEGDPTESVPFG